jgi:hypothetical protein
LNHLRFLCCSDSLYLFACAVFPISEPVFCLNQPRTFAPESSYQQFAEERRERRTLAREAFGKFLTDVCIEGGKRLSNAPIGEGRLGIERASRPYGYLLGDLDEARAKFLAATKLKAVWPAEYERATLSPEDWAEGGYDADPPPPPPPPDVDARWEFDFEDRPKSGRPGAAH